MADSGGAVLTSRSTAAWANVGGDWAQAVSSGAATFEAWIRTTATASQTIVMGADGSGAAPRISVGGDRLSVYWDPSGEGPGLTSADTTPVTDGAWHHIAVVFDGGAITFYKDAVATADRLALADLHPASGTLQLGAGLGSTTGFVGQLYDVRVWSVARSAEQISSARWATLTGKEPGLTAVTSFDAAAQTVVNRVGGAGGELVGCGVVTTDLPSPTCALSFGGGPADDVVMSGVGEISSAAATVECWLRMPAGAAATAQTLAYVQTGPDVAPWFQYGGDDRLGCAWLGTAYQSADTRPISDGQWHHVALVLRNGLVTFYKDGVATADSASMPNSFDVTGGDLHVGGGIAPAAAFTGELYDVRLWSTARTAAEISSFRYVELQGDEPGLVALCTLAGANPADPATMVPVNQVGGAVAAVSGDVEVVPTALPQQPLPTSVWTYPTPGESPVGPLLSAQGLLSVDAGATSGAFLRSVELETGQVGWSYDVRQQGELDDAVVTKAVGATAQTAFVGAQGPSANAIIELHAVDIASGAPVWPRPAQLTNATAFLTRPAVLAGTLFFGAYASDDENKPGPALVWGDPGTGEVTVGCYLGHGPQDFMTAPVLDGTAVYVASNQSGGGYAAAVPVADLTEVTPPSWQIKLPAPVTADLVFGSSTLYVPVGGAVVAVDAADGSVRWTHQLSGSPVTSRPVLAGSTLFVGSTDGVLYALDAATGAEQWRVDTGSPIVTDLALETGVLYFANQGTDVTGPAFLAVDTNSLGNDVVSYPVPGADSILFVSGGVTNGVVYFYGSQDVYAVNMANVVHEFDVTSKLIVEDYTTDTDTPTGSDTSYRVTLKIRDENGVPRTKQAVKLWSAGTLYVVNQGEAPVPLTPASPVWMQTDASGALTLAVSAFDDGTPSGTPNVSCPPLYAWANFMSAGEAVVIYSDHESLTTLANVQGSSTSVEATGTASQYLGQATGYDGSPLVLSAYQDQDSLSAIASTIRNTVGTRNAASVGAGYLAPSTRYVRRGGVLPNVVHAPDTAASPNRPYVPGADPVFTVDLSGATPVYRAGTYDPSAPATLLADGSDLRGVFSDIEHFADNVVKGAEKVAKMAWQFTEDAVETVIHTAESVYNLVITDVEDAVTAVVGFLKSVVADIRKVIQWLSALFDWGNILKNHTYIRNAITNPSDPANPGIIDRLSTWITSELNGGTDASSVLAQLSGQSSAAVGSTAQATAGQTVQSQQAGNNDPNAVYNTGGNNNADQCAWMRQKVTENSSGGSAGTDAVLLASWDPSTVTAAFERFLAAVEAALEGSFGQLPDQVRQALSATTDSFKDPKTVLSTGLSDLLAVFQALADDMVVFAKAVAKDFLQLLGTLLTEVVSWLAQPIDIPFVSALYHALTGEQLSVLDLVCLLAAVPGTILLAVITGSPTVPDTTDAALVGGTPAGQVAGRILLGIAAFAIGEFGDILDLVTMDWRSTMPSWFVPMPPSSFTVFLSWLDFSVDFIAWALGLAVSFAWTSWQRQDWIYWTVQAIPQACNFAYLFRSDGTGQKQVIRDTLFGACFLVTSAVFAHFWPSDYRDAPKAAGLVLSANVFGASSSISEVLMLFLDPWDWIPVEAPVKVALYTVGGILSFTANVLDMVD